MSIINFGAGPAKLPEEVRLLHILLSLDELFINFFCLKVLSEVQENLVSYQGTGLSVMEMSHRGSQYNTIHNNTIQTVKDLM